MSEITTPLLLVLFFAFNSCEKNVDPPVADPNIVTDIDGNTYKTIQIGDQVWMADNLRTTHYADGAAIPYVESTSNWNALDVESRAYCWYDNNPANKDILGGLYTWTAAMNGVNSSEANPSRVQGVCPSGWHLPSDAEWKELEVYLGMSQADADGTLFRGTDEGGMMKEEGTSHWNSPNTSATNTSGLTALPGGFRSYNGPFAYTGENAYFWTSTQRVTATAWYRNLWYNYAESYRQYIPKVSGASIRCVKD